MISMFSQVLEDISELRKKWVQARVDRVSHNTYKLYQVRKNLKESKVGKLSVERHLDFILPNCSS